MERAYLGLSNTSRNENEKQKIKEEIANKHQNIIWSGPLTNNIMKIIVKKWNNIISVADNI